MKIALVMILSLLPALASASDKECSDPGEYVWGNECCPGLSETRVSNDGYVCVVLSRDGGSNCIEAGQIVVEPILLPRLEIGLRG